MKNTKLACCVLALGIVFAVSNTYADSTQMREALSQVSSLQQASSLKTGSTFVMACSKCKTVLLQKVDHKKGFLSWFTPKTKHDCPGCSGTMVYNEYAGGKGHQVQYVHTCSKCGDKSTFCCGTVGNMKM